MSSTAGPALRELFDSLIELPPDVREAQIVALDLPDAVGDRLRAMIVFDELVALPAEQRSARVAALDLADEVHARVHAMLSADETAPAAVRVAAAEAIDQLCDNEDEVLAQSLVGTWIGNFRLLALLGHGGSSVVFRAEREAGDGAQVVALKLLRTGLYSANAQRRFRREQAILAQLTHPNIAGLIEAGVSSAGIPYIAMELVEGLPITQAADARALDIEQRLRWFAALCRTIEAAHSALIVHRDLKPSNLLVTRDGDLKVLDFGIAKLLDEQDHVTRTQSIVLTPEYAAPEQYGAAAPTTAVDVYALGVVLGELLTGERLCAGCRATTAVSAARMPLPRGLPERAALVRQLRGDLDDIVACALADDATLRYSSAGAFADDVERYLARKPVRAHPPSRSYRARKFVRRHRGAVAALSASLLAIIGGLGVVAWQEHSIAREAQRAESTRDFLLRVFSAAEPAGPRLAPPSVADVVRASIAEARHSATLQPAVRIELIDALGGVLRKQGDIDGGLKLLETNYADAVATLGASEAATLQAGLGVVLARADAGQLASARALLDDLIRRSPRGAHTDLQARLLAASADLGTERFERERALAESAVAVEACEDGGCDARTRIATLVTRGNALAGFNDENAAIPVLEQAVELQRRLFGGPHIELADTLQALSRACRRVGQLDRAEALARESLAIVESSVPDPHLRRAGALDALRQVLIDSRKLDEAVALGLRVVAMDEATRGAGHPAVATDQNTLGFTYMLQGDYAHAAERFLAALTISEALPDNERRSAIYQADLGYSVGLAGDVVRGSRLILAALERFRAQAEVDYSEVSSALEKLGDLQRRSAAFADALATYAEADAIYRDQLRTGPSEWHARTLVGIGRTLAERRGDDLGAERALREALARITTPATRTSALRIEAETVLVEVLIRRGNAGEARRLLDAANAESAAARGPLPLDLRLLLQRANADATDAVLRG